MSFIRQESIVQTTQTNPIGDTSFQMQERNGGSVIQLETIVNPQLRESQFMLSSTPREKVIPLDVQQTVTKKVDQQIINDYEMRILCLQHKVEIWRKRCLDMMAVYDSNLANEEVLKIKLLQRENQGLYSQIRALTKENDELMQRLTCLKLSSSNEESKSNYENLQVLLKSRLTELDEWRDKNNKLESSYQGQFKGLEGQAALWQERYWAMVDERNKLQGQLFDLNERLQAVQIEAAQRNNATEIKLRDAEILKLKSLIQHLNASVDEWRKRTLQMETEVELKQQDVDAQKVKVNKLLEQQKNDNLNEILEKKNSDIRELRKEISRLENNYGELRHEKLLKVEFEAENKRLVETVEQFKQLASDRNSQLDALKIKYGNPKIEKNQIQQRLEETKYLTTQIKQLTNENRNLFRSVKYLEDSIYKQEQQ